jgi:putative flippase GtrA
MNNMNAWLRETMAQFARFGVVGVMNVIINAVVYVGLVWLGVHYLIASVCGSCLGVLNSFVMSKFFVFGAEGDGVKQFFKTVGVYGVQFAVSWTGLVILIEIFGLNPYAAYVANIVVVTLVSFFGLKLFAFRPGEKADGGLTGD